MTATIDNSHRTAIRRKKLSNPAAWLDRAGYLQGRVLDYGCGRGEDAERLGCVGYDPYYAPERPVGLFRTVMCNFVLNVIESADERHAVLADIDALLEEKGIAYITVRNDRKKLRGKTSIGTWQGLIVLMMPHVRKTSDYITYIVQKGQSDCTIKAETL